MYIVGIVEYLRSMTAYPTNKAAYWIKKLDLQPHPEGGFYKETYRSSQEVSRAGSATPKNSCTSIYYLLESADFSGFHRLLSDEIWYFHTGAPLFVHSIDPNGMLITQELSDQETGNLSVVISGGKWFAAELPGKDGFTLASCAVAPGFDFAEFEMAKKKDMLIRYPAHAAVLERLCRL